LKILWVKAGGLVPLDSGGKIRSFHILKELARKHEITVYTYYAEHSTDVHDTLDGLFSRLVCRPLKIAPPRSFPDFVHYVKNLFRPYPHVFSRYNLPIVSQELRSLAQSERYDVIVCDFLIPAQVIPWDYPCAKILFTHNVEATIYRRHYETARNPLWKLAAWREFRVTKQTEDRYLAQANHVLTVSDADRNSFAHTVHPSKITTIPTGVDIEYFHPESGSCEPHTLVFTGSMDWLPNEDGILFFASQILPRIREQIPDASVLIVGRRPSPKLQSLAALDRRIHVTGKVEDVRPFIRRGSVYIVPLRIGGGTRLKIFEAMAMGKAVVSTAIGAEGLPVKDGLNIRIADSAEEFARSVVALLQDPVAREKLERSGRQLVQQEYSWAAVATHFELALNRLIEGKAGCSERSSKGSSWVRAREFGPTKA
jgi:glycosyltransferase involved in cell wall biosynthesis